MKALVPDSKTILRSLLVNLFLSLAIVSLEFYAGGFLDGVFYYIRQVLETPCFFILTLIQGRTRTLHATGEKTYLIVSLVFYSLSIAAVQVAWFRRKTRTTL